MDEELQLLGRKYSLERKNIQLMNFMNSSTSSELVKKKIQEEYQKNNDEIEKIKVTILRLQNERNILKHDKDYQIYLKQGGKKLSYDTWMEWKKQYKKEEREIPYSLVGRLSDWASRKSFEMQKKEVIATKKIEIDFYARRLEDITKYNNKLINCFRLANMNKLADDLEKLSLAFWSTELNQYCHYIYELEKDQADINYIKNQYNYNLEEEQKGKRYIKYKIKPTPKEEYKKIKQKYIIMSKEQTKKAKRYHELYLLYQNSTYIIKHMKQYKVNTNNGASIADYFNNKYIICDGDRKIKSVGYQFLEFYRNKNSKYNKDKRR